MPRPEKGGRPDWIVSCEERPIRPDRLEYWLQRRGESAWVYIIFAVIAIACAADLIYN